MILRRLSQHVKDQNWFAVGLDFLIVVLGILIAFQITVWNQGRQDRAIERKYLVRLAVELDQNFDALAKEKETVSTKLAVTNYLFDEISETPQPNFDACRFVTAIGMSSLFDYPEPLRQTYDELISSGKLALIRSESVKDSLSQYFIIFDYIDMRRPDIQSLARDYVYIWRGHMPTESGRRLNRLAFSNRNFDIQTVRMQFKNGSLLPADDESAADCEFPEADMNRFRGDLTADARFGAHLQSIEAIYLAQDQILDNLMARNRRTREIIAADLGESPAETQAAP